MKRGALFQSLRPALAWVLVPGVATAIARADPSPGGHPAGRPERACAAAQVAYDYARGETYERYAARARRSHCIKPWTVLVYMAADNDLAPYAFWDLYEMEAGYRSDRVAAGSTERSDLLVQLATPESGESRRIHVFQAPEPFDSALSLEEFKNRGARDIRSPVAARVPRKDRHGSPLAAAEEFRDFLEWGMREYPAEHYMVVVWGHGQGWAPRRRATLFGEPRRFGGVGFSDSQGTYLDIPSLRRALRAAERRVLGGRPIDVYASDSCLMQMVEVATEISDAARFVVGSSQVQNYLGLPYRRMMLELNTGRFAGEASRPGVAGSDLAKDEPYLLASMLPRLLRMSLEPAGLHGRFLPEAIETVTMSAISSSELESLLLPALERLARALDRYLAEDPFRAIALQDALYRAPTFLGGSQELGGFLALARQALRAELDGGGGEPTPAARGLQGALDEASDALNRTVISYALGTRYRGSESGLHLLGFRALAAWLPLSPEDHASRIEDFASSRFYRLLHGAWREWLDRLYR